VQSLPSSHALVFDCAARATEAVVLVLWEEGTTGIEELDGDRFRAHFEREPSGQVVRSVRRAGGRGMLRESVAGIDWVRRSRQHERVRRVGRLLIRPIWSRVRPRGRELDLVIDSPRAFGTGSHESTRLALRQLLARAPGGDVLDVGTGSGILALAALRLGWTQAVALDVEAEAVHGAIHNAVLNGLMPRLWPVLGSLACVTARFPLVLANLTAPLLIELAPALADRVQPGGALILSGILRSELALVVEHHVAAGLMVGQRLSDRDWSAVALKKGPP